MRKEMFNIKVKNLGVYLVNCGYEDCCGNFLCPLHMRNYYLFHYVTKGSGFFETDGSRYAVKEGEVFIIRPNTPVTYYSPDINDTWSFCWFGFNGKDAREWLADCGIDESTVVMTVKNPIVLSTVMNCIEYMDSHCGNLSQTRLVGFLSQALNAVNTKNKVKKLSPVENVDKAVRFIEYNYMKKISVSDISEFLNLERSYFYRIFKRYTGSSPERYLIDYRIKRACELLRLDKYSVSEIAEFVGVDDVYYFSKLFKSTVGVPPRKYRAEQKR